MRLTLLSLFCVISCLAAKAQNWSPFRLDAPNYFLHPNVTGYPGMQECLSVRFDTILSTLPLPTYRKAWPVIPESFSRPQMFLYRPWHYFGTAFIPDSINRIYQVMGGRTEHFHLNDTLHFLPASLTFSHPRQLGDTVLRGDSIVGLLEMKVDTIIENQADSVATIRLNGSYNEGKRIILSKNRGLMELPSFSAEDSMSGTLKRHFEGPGRRFDSRTGDHLQWARGAELHFVSQSYTYVPLSAWGPASTNIYSEKRIVRCVDNGMGGLAYTGTFSSSLFYQQGTQIPTITTITDSVFTLNYPPRGKGTFESMADTFSINQSTYNKVSGFGSGPVNCTVLPGNLALKYYYHEILDAAFFPLKALPPFEGGTFGEVGVNPQVVSRMSSYPVFYKFGNDSAGIRLPAPTAILPGIKGGISVYPNPASQSCQIVSNAGPVSEIRLIDTQGRYKTIPFNPTESRANLEFIPAGLYMLDIGLQSGTRHLVRLVKE